MADLDGPTRLRGRCQKLNADERTVVGILAALMECPKSMRVDTLALATRAAIDGGVVSAWPDVVLDVDESDTPEGRDETL